MRTERLELKRGNQDLSFESKELSLVGLRENPFL